MCTCLPVHQSTKTAIYPIFHIPFIHSIAQWICLQQKNTRSLSKPLITCVYDLMAAYYIFCLFIIFWCIVTKAVIFFRAHPLWRTTRRGSILYNLEFSGCNVLMCLRCVYSDHSLRIFVSNYAHILHHFKIKLKYADILTQDSQHSGVLLITWDTIVIRIIINKNIHGLYIIHYSNTTLWRPSHSRSLQTK